MMSGRAQFKVILVYDVSPLGAFKMLMKLPTMSSFAGVRVFPCGTVLSNSRMMDL